MLNCQDIEHLLDGYLDGELPGSLRAEVHAHLLQCLVCRQRVGLLQAAADVVRAGGSEPQPSADFTERVLERLEQRRRGRLRWPLRRVAVVVGPIISAAAAIALVVLLWGRAPQPGRVLGVQEQGLAQAVVALAEQTRQRSQQLRSSADALAELGQQALWQANAALLRDLVEADGSGQPPQAAMPLLGQLLIPLSDVLELKLEGLWPQQPGDAADQIDLI